MPAAKYNREPPLAASKAKVHHNYENVNLYAKDIHCFGNSSNYMGHGEKRMYLSTGDNQISDVTRDYVNLATPCEANSPAGTGSLHFKASADAFCPKTTQMVDNNGADGNFYLTLAGPSKWQDLPVSIQTADEELSMQYKVYENYPLCTFVNTQPTQTYCTVADKNNQAMLLAGPNYVNMKYGGDLEYLARASGDCNGINIETRKPQSSNWNLSELDYAIEHCRKIESRAVDGHSTHSHSVMALENGQQPKIGREITSNNGGFYQLCTRMDRSEAVKHHFNDIQEHSNDTQVRDHQMLSPSVKQEVNTDISTTKIAPPLPDKEISTSKFTHKNKVSTALTINEQIRTLRAEMVELRSTTMTFKHHMEKMFDDLSYINRIHRSNTMLHTEPTNISPSEITNVPILVDQQAYVNSRSNQVVSDATRKKFAGASNMSPSRGSSIPQKVIASKREEKQCYVNSNVGEASVEHTTAVPVSADHLEPPTRSKVTVQRLADKEQKRTKSVDRPNSDSFASALSSEKQFANKCENGDMSMSLPHTPNVTCKPNIHRAAKYQKSSTDNLRVLPVLSHSNAALHISECSIDSGYQGSSVTTPRERQTSQVVTPASPISEFPAMPKEKQDQPLILPLETKTISLRGDCTDVFLSQCPPADLDFLTSKHLESFVRIHRPKLNSRDTLSSLDSVDSRKEVPEIAVAVRPKPRTLNSKASTSSENDDERPVPKPRAKHKNESINSSEQKSSRDLNEQAVSRIKLHQTSTVDKCVPEADTMKISSPEKQAPQQCLTVLKQTSLTQVATNVSGAGQKRVKLGVSAISNVNKDHQTKHVAQDARVRQANKTKQALKEKFAAVLEHSRERNNVPSGNLSDDSELSVVRRRSMRMMTEFQIYDFKDSSASLSSLLNGTSQPKTKVLMQDEVYHSTSNIIANVSDQANGLCNSSPNQRTTVENKSANNKHRQPDNQSVVSDLALPISQISTHDGQASEARCEYELPPPPPPPPRSPHPPRSPPLVADRPPSNANSQTSLYSEMELHLQCQMPKMPVALPLQLIRPKPALPGVSCDFNSSQASICGGKISQSAGSAFTPVLSSSLRSLHQKPSPIADRYDVPFESIEQGCKQNDRRRVSLPLASVSNRAKAIGEMNTNTIPTESHRVTEHGDKNHVQRRSSLRYHRKQATESLGTVISAEQATITSYSVYNSQKDHPGTEHNCTSDHLHGVHSGKAKFDVQGKDRSSPEPNMATNDIASHDLENQPVRYNRSDNIKHVVSALRTAGYLAGESAASNKSQQVNSSNTSSIASSNATQQFVRSAKSHSSSRRSGESSRTRSTERHHHYETLKEKTDQACSKNNMQTAIQPKAALPRHRSKSKENVFDPPDGVAEMALPSKNKSTVAFLRASFMGKKDKTSKNAVVDIMRAPKGKYVPAQRSKLVSSESKTKHQESASTKLKTDPKTKTADSKRKEASTRKNNIIDTKQQKDKSSLKKSSKSDHKLSLSKGSKEVRHLPGLPESSEPIYRGNADPEVMERFLNATANTSASSNPRSPLQKLRSSFRAPRNKTKYLQSQNKVKDDMDVSKMNGSGLSFLSGHGSKKLALKQDHYTYV